MKSIIGKDGDGQAHQDIGQGKVEDETPATTAPLSDQDHQGDSHQEVGGDDQKRHKAQDPAHYGGMHLLLKSSFGGIYFHGLHGVSFIHLNHR